MTAICVLLAAGVSAQETPKMEVRGTLSEIGLGDGIAGAQISVYEFSKDSARSIFATGLTDGQGSFAFYFDRPGNYYFEVKKSGYFAGDAATAQLEQLSAKATKRQAEGPAEATGALATLSKDHPREFLRLALMRHAELRGRVVDEMDNPLKSVRVELLEPGAQTTWLATGTGPDGTFRIGQARPGQYVVRVVSYAASATGPKTEFTDEDQNKVDEGLETMYWPGVRDASAAGTVTLVPEAPVDLGTIRMIRTPLYRMRVSLRGCEPGDKLRYFLIRSEAGMAMPSSIESCDDFLVSNLAPGPWVIQLQGGTKWAETSVEIVNKNVAVSAAIQPNSEISGQVVLAHDGMSLDGVKPMVTLEPVRSLGMPRMVRGEPVKDGLFSFRGVMGRTHVVTVGALGPRYYVKEIRADGVASSDGTVTLGPASRIDIVIDDQPATLTGVVTEGDQAAPQPKIFLQRMPPLVAARFAPNGIADATGDGDGRFQVAGLAPGAYRVLALPGGPVPDGVNEWKISSRMWERAETVTLERGKSTDLKLKLTEPLI